MDGEGETEGQTDEPSLLCLLWLNSQEAQLGVTEGQLLAIPRVGVCSPICWELETDLRKNFFACLEV